MSFSSFVASLSPTGWWRCGDSSSPLSDSSGSGHGATYTTGVTTGVAGGVSGDSDTAVTLSSTSNDPEITYGSWMDAAASFSIWVVAKSTQNTGTPQMLARDDLQIPARLWQMRFNLGKFEFVKIPGTTVTASSPLTYSDGTYRDFGVTYDGANIKLYVEGVLVKTQAATGSMGTLASKLFIGHRKASNGSLLDFWGGSLDEIIYKAGTAWTQTDFTNLHAARIGSLADKTITISTTSTGVVGKSSGAAKTVTISAAAAGRLGISGQAVKTVTASTASAGVRGAVAGAAAVIAITTASAGFVTSGISGDAAPTINISATAAGSLGISGTAVKTIAVSTASQGVRGKTGAASQTVTISTVAAVRLGIGGSTAKTIAISTVSDGTVDHPVGSTIKFADGTTLHVMGFADGTPLSVQGLADGTPLA